ncbi:hypothetical protein C8J57DRAFT_1276078, partial [Mycena rebaudengoi]
MHGTQERKIPPACDSCKSRRVLCHSQPDGSPCLRCAENGIICTTTPLPRGRPPKTRQGNTSISSFSSGSGSSGAGSSHTRGPSL